jgi:Tol biopolymer transport system component
VERGLRLIGFHSITERLTMRKLTATLIGAVLPVLVAGCSSSDATAPDDNSNTGVVPAILAVRATSGAGGGALVRVNADGTNLQTLTTTTLTTGAVESADTGNFIVYADGPDAASRRLYVIQNGGAPRLLVGANAEIASAFAPAFSPDGSTIYFRGSAADDLSRSAIWRVNRSGSGLARVSAFRATAVGGPSIAPDGKTLMESTADSVVFTIFSTGATHGEQVYCPGARYSPDGVHVACVSGTSLLVYDAQFLTTPRVLGDGTYMAAAGTDWTPDGTKILATSTVHGPELIDFATGNVESSALGAGYSYAAFVR